MIAAHPDDEFGCAGTIARFLEEGAQVFYACMSDSHQSLSEDDDPNTRVKEAKECMRRLGLHDDAMRFGSFTLRRFQEERQDILEAMLKLREEIEPDAVLVPCSHDKHQDHQVVSAEAFRAFKHSTLLGYALPQNLLFFTNSLFVVLEEKHVRAKLHALSAHESQADKPYAAQDFIRGFASMCGVQGGVTFAEAYEVVRFMVTI